MKGLMACRIHHVMAWNASSASEDLRCKFGLLLVITKPWNSPVIGFLPALHPFYQRSHHFRWLSGQHGGWEERKFRSSNITWIIGHILVMWPYALLNFVKKRWSPCEIEPLPQLTAPPSMRQWLWSLTFICLFFFWINTMPKCVGCKKEFKGQGFSMHKKSCRPYKQKIKACLIKVPDSDLVAGPSNENAILDDTDDLGTAEDMLVDDIPVCNREMNDQKNKKLISLLIYLWPKKVTVII